MERAKSLSGWLGFTWFVRCRRRTKSFRVNLQVEGKVWAGMARASFGVLWEAGDGKWER